MAVDVSAQAAHRGIDAYLAAPQGDDAEELRHLHEIPGTHEKAGSRAEQALPARIANGHCRDSVCLYHAGCGAHRGFGLDVKLNDHNARLQIDTGAGGLLISRSVANGAGLKAFSQNEIGGIGDEGLKAGYTAYVDTIRIGNLEFQNCAVEVMDKRNFPGDIDGLIGMDVFSHFLVTLDYPMRKLLLGPLPPRPGEQPPRRRSSNTGSEDEGSDDNQDPGTGRSRFCGK